MTAFLYQRSLITQAPEKTRGRGRCLARYSQSDQSTGPRSMQQLGRSPPRSVTSRLHTGPAESLASSPADSGELPDFVTSDVDGCKKETNRSRKGRYAKQVRPLHRNVRNQS